MGFAVGTVEEKLQEKAVRGNYQKVAVGCWFTATGKAIPQMLKYEDEAGVRHMLKNIQVLKTDQKYYAGILSQRYDCSAVVEGRMRRFTLLYHPGENTWDMVLMETVG